MRWDVFCRVIDNHGDLGVCWRLAADLAARGESVRLWVDDAAALTWMAPGGADGVEVRPWPSTEVEALPGDVAIEAFGCELPPFFAERMAALRPAPVWINLEYLSAEPFVERSHGLPSPQRNGLTKWFFYPGFGERTGGLLREPGVLQARRAFDNARWRADQGIAAAPGERVVSLFCYDNAALADLLRDLAAEPTLLLVTPGLAARQVHELVGDRSRFGSLRTAYLPYRSQPEFDRLLWSCDLNIVRGEDSAVRAIWAGAPFVWQFYPQEDGAHHAKREAFIERYLGGIDSAWSRAVGGLWRAWNGAAPWVGLPSADEWQAWRSHAQDRRDSLAARDDLCTQLGRFVREKQ